MSVSAIGILQTLPELWHQLTVFEQSILVVNSLLFVFSSKIVGLLNQQSITYGYNSSFKVTAFRAINLLLIAVVLLKNYFISVDEDLSWYLKLIGVMLTVYASFLTTQVMHFLLLKKYGKEKTINNATVVTETYNSRMLEIVSIFLIVIVAIIAIIQILGLDNLLEAGGVIGFLGVMLALTQGSWAPDIISGLIILNSGLIEDGDVIELEKDKTIGLVHKTRLFYTEILNLVDNHRIMIGNSQLRSMQIHNLSKFASAKGLRESLFFKIGYDVPANKVKECFQTAYEDISCDKDLEIEKQHPLEIKVIDTGDDAIEWGVFYYIKNVRKLMKTRQCFREQILEAALERNISLATPKLHVIENHTGN